MPAKRHPPAGCLDRDLLCLERGVPLAGGMTKTDLMTLAGWRSRTMVSRYAASAATERATEVGKRLNPGDKR